MRIQKILKWVIVIGFLGGFLKPVQAQWETLEFPGVGRDFPDILGLAFFDEENGIGVGKDGIIIKITDAGNQWDTVFQNPDYQFEAVVVTHNATAIAVGHKTPLPPCGSGDDDGIVAKTEDGGNTWTTTFTKEGLWSVDFPSIQVGYAGSDCGQAYKSIDAGASWTLIDDNQGLEAIAFSIDFVDTQTGFISFEKTSPLQSRLFKTIDGGDTWTNISPAGYTDLYRNVFFYDLQFGYISVDGDLLVTNNGGNDWTMVYDNETGITYYSPFDSNVIYFGPPRFTQPKTLICRWFSLCRANFQSSQ